MEEDRQPALPDFREQCAQALRRREIDLAVCRDPLITVVPAGICLAFGEIERDIGHILEPGFARFGICRRGWCRLSCRIEHQGGANRRDSGGMQAKRRYGTSYVDHWRRLEMPGAGGGSKCLRSLTLPRRMAKIQVAVFRLIMSSYLDVSVGRVRAGCEKRTLGRWQRLSRPTQRADRLSCWGRASMKHPHRRHFLR